MIVREAQAKDLSSIVRVHQNAFNDFLMSDLGPKFLMAYYKMVFDYSNHVCFVVMEDTGKIVGFVIGFLEPNILYEHLNRKKHSLGIASFIYLAPRPKLWLRVFRSLRKAQSLACDKDYGEGVVELSSIAVIKSYAGRGLGKSLISAFLECSSNMGAKRVHLKTDALKNKSVNDFYQKLGFDLYRTVEVSSNRPMNEYVFKL